MMNRRLFLQSLAASAAVTGLDTGLGVRQALAFETPNPGHGRMVVIFLRGGLDGLYAFAPVADPRLVTLRPTIAKTVLTSGIALPGSGFAAHPSCSGLVDLYKGGELSFAPCAGTVDKSRSHFQAQDLFELGTGQFHGDVGFMARTARVLGGSGTAVSFTQEIPLSFQGLGEPPQIAPLTGSGLKIPGGALQQALLAAHRNEPTGESLQQAITTQSEIDASMGMEPNASRNAAAVNGFPKVAQQMGRFLAANPSLNLAFLDLGGFDTHIGEDNVLSRSLQNFSQGITTLKDSLGPTEWARTRVVVMSEFGRTVRENGTQGTDHGHGGLALLAGGAIHGGKMLGDFHGLADNALNENRDLPVSLDWRKLLGDTMHSSFDLNKSQLAQVFPGYSV